MKKRYLYSLLLAMPGFFISIVISAILSGMALGFFWLYVFGDSDWPIDTGTLLTIFFSIFLLFSWAIFIVLGFTIGKGLENSQISSKKHILISIILTIIFFLFTAYFFLNYRKDTSQSNIGKCSAFCSKAGYKGAALWDENNETLCACADNSGKTIIKVPFSKV
ncbi:MAG: hypothetical protein HYS02_01275 [Candidatus Staskawiczbacteria bacterium]|nr:hypothetical protein [Candidatus Staskawiczbacteria bacterium]